MKKVVELGEVREDRERAKVLGDRFDVRKVFEDVQAAMRENGEVEGLVVIWTGKVSEEVTRIVIGKYGLGKFEFLGLLECAKADFLRATEG